MPEKYHTCPACNKQGYTSNKAKHIASAKKREEADLSLEQLHAGEVVAKIGRSIKVMNPI